jgi:hypothetical protein
MSESEAAELICELDPENWKRNYEQQTEKPTGFFKKMKKFLKKSHFSVAKWVC